MGYEHLGFRIGPRTVHARVSDYADDREPVAPGVEVQPPADGILVRPIALRGFLVDHCYPKRVTHVTRLDTPPREQRDP
jgi:hypothetical protein